MYTVQVLSSTSQRLTELHRCVDDIDDIDMAKHGGEATLWKSAPLATGGVFQTTWEGSKLEDWKKKLMKIC